MNHDHSHAHAQTAIFAIMKLLFLAVVAATILITVLRLGGLVIGQACRDTNSLKRNTR